MGAARRVLEGQAAVVTGASSGIGRAIAEALAEAGADVVVSYRSQEDAAAEVVSACESHGVRAIAVDGDVSKEPDVVALFDAAREAFGTVHVVVPNAGIQRDEATAAMTLDAWQQVIDVNLTGQFLCAREAIREFDRRGPVPSLSRSVGKIVHMSSVHEQIPWAGHANYAAAKGGVMLLMKSLAQEVADRGIRVNGVAPGAIRTPINRDAWEKEEALARLLELIPYGRIGEPEDVARAVVWLASDEADYVVGTTLFVDGGMALYPAFRHGG